MSNAAKFFALQSAKSEMKSDHMRAIIDYFIWAHKPESLAIIDLTAGRGQFDDGTMGSGAHALDSLNKKWDMFKAEAEIDVVLNDRSPDNVAAINQMVHDMNVPENIKVHVTCSDMVKTGVEAVRQFKRRWKLVLIDPCSLSSLDMDMIGEITSMQKTIVFVSASIGFMRYELSVHKNGSSACRILGEEMQSREHTTEAEIAEEFKKVLGRRANNVTHLGSYPWVGVRGYAFGGFMTASAISGHPSHYPTIGIPQWEKTKS